MLSQPYWAARLCKISLASCQRPGARCRPLDPASLSLLPRKKRLPVCQKLPVSLHDSAMRSNRTAPWGNSRPRWSCEPSSEPEEPQDAYSDGPQSHREVQGLCLRAGELGGGQWEPSPGSGVTTSEEQSPLVFGLWPTRSRLRPPRGTKIRVRATVGDCRVLHLPDEASEMRLVRCE